MPFFKNEEQEGKTCGRGKDIRKGYRRVNVWKYYILRYENGKMRPVETLPRMGEGGIKETDGGEEYQL
jgi:plasmid stabilization system protein ParE